MFSVNIMEYPLIDYITLKQDAVDKYYRKMRQQFLGVSKLHHEVYKSKTTRMTFTLAMSIVMIISLMIPAALSPIITIIIQPASAYTACNCVIFRMDDVTDYGYNNIQVAIMNHFIQKHEPLTTSIIASTLNSGTKVQTKVEEGYDKGLFDLAIHGWKHVDHSKLTVNEQRDYLKQAHKKIKQMFGDDSNIFAPPFNKYTLTLVQTMGDLRIDTLTTSYYEESINSNPYKEPLITADSKIEISNFLDSNGNAKKVYHVPFNISFLDLQRKGLSGDSLVQEMIKKVNTNIGKYGFAVVVVHASDFARVDEATGKKINSVDPNKFSELTTVMDDLRAAGKKIVHIAEVTN